MCSTSSIECTVYWVKCAMSDTPGDMTNFIGIPRADYGYATLKSADESHPNENKSSDLIEQDTIADENHFKNEEIPKEQETVNNVSENATNGKLPKNELEFSIEQEKTTNELHKKNGLEIPVEEEINIDSESIVLDATTEGMKENQSSNRVNTSVKSEIKTLSSLSDCNDGSLTKEDGEVSQDTQFTGHTDKQNSNSESGFKTEVETNEKQISGSLEHSNAESSVKEDGKVSQSTQVLDGKVDDQNSSCESDSKKSIIEMNDTSWTEYSDEDSSEEEIFVDRDLPSNTTDPDGRADEQNFSSDSNSKKSLETLEENAEESEDTSEGEVFVDQDLPANTKDHDGRVDEHNSSSDSNFKKSSDEAVEENAEEPVKDTSEVEIAVHQDLPARQGHRTSEQVAEIISTFFNSPEYTRKLKEIDDIVKQLTAVEFVSPDLSPEDWDALEELYGQQAAFEKDSDSDSETDAEMFESNVMKRKSKLSELDEDAEEHQVASKKYKFSKDLDSKTQSGENPCCLEEQFRLAYEEANEGLQGQLQRDKEYNFPITTGNGEYMKKRYKLCKHQLDKIDAMVVNAMSLENYVYETDNYENGVGRKGRKLYKSKGIQRGNENSTDVFSSSESRIPKPGTSSARTRRYSEKNVQCEEKSFHSKERFSGVLRGNTKGSGFVWFGEAFNYVKNLILCVSFTGSLMIAITIARVFGVTFPVPKSQRNNLRNNLKNSLQEFPDVNLEEP